MSIRTPVVRAPQVVYSDTDLVVGEVGALSVSIWRGVVTPARFEQQRRGLLEVARRRRPRAAFLCVVEPTATGPGSDLRKASAQMMDAVQGELCCAAMVIEGSGFKPAFNRSVLIAISMLMKPRAYPMNYYAESAFAASWIGEHLGVNGESLERDVESLREAFPDS